MRFIINQNIYFKYSRFVWNNCSAASKSIRCSKLKAIQTNNHFHRIGLICCFKGCNYPFHCLTDCSQYVYEGIVSLSPFALKAIN